MKKQLITLIAMLLPMLASAEAVEIDGIYYNLKPEIKVAEVTKTNQYSGEVVIPEYVRYNDVDYSVTSIGSSAFSNCRGLTSVTIPNSVTTIGEFAFEDCSGLTSVHISDIVAWCKIFFRNSYSNPLTYAQHLFLNGKEIKDLVIPNSVISIWEYAFSGCSGLTSVTIPNSVTSICKEAFKDCSSLTSVTIPNSVTFIGAGAFSYCRGLTSVSISNSITSIEKEVFLYCSGLTSVIIPNSVTSIGERAFSLCSSLSSISIGNSVTSIGQKAFGNCKKLMSVTSNINEPYSINNNVFTTETYRQGTLYIPAGTEKLYTRFDGWREFLNIMETGSVGPVNNIRGDLNNDGKLDAADIVELVNLIMNQ